MRRRLRGVSGLMTAQRADGPADGLGTGGGSRFCGRLPREWPRSMEPSSRCWHWPAIRWRRRKRPSAAAPGMVLARVYRAYLSLYAMTADGVAAAATLLDRLDGGGRRARAAAPGGGAGVGGRGLDRGRPRPGARAGRAPAGRRSRSRSPRTSTSSSADRLDLRDVAARVLAPGRRTSRAGATCRASCAFGLEENGDYRARRPRREAALARQPARCLGVHAARPRLRDGGPPPRRRGFLCDSRRTGASSYFAVHNWWHLGLYQLELGGSRPLSSSTTSTIRAAGPPEWLDIVDAAALLWRLSLYGADRRATGPPAGRRHRALLESAPVYVFNDWHAGHGVRRWTDETTATRG